MGREGVVGNIFGTRRKTKSVFDKMEVGGVVKLNLLSIIRLLLRHPTLMD